MNKNIVDVFPMNDIQRGMVLLSIMNPNAAVYHDQFIFYVPPVDPDDFRQALRLMMEKHPILRTGFELDNYSDEVQIVYNDIEPNLEFEDLTSLETAEQGKYIHDYMINERFKIYDFKTPPLWRVTIFNLNEENSVYLIQFHHAVLDGWSLASFNTQVFNTYGRLKKDKNYKPEPLKVFFKDLVVEEIAEKNNLQSINYWKEKLKDFNRLDIFHNDKPTTELARISFGMERSRLLREKALSKDLHYKNVAFGAFVYVLNMLALEDDFVVGVVSNNRPPIEDGDQVLGCFLNTLPLRLKFDQVKNMTWLEYFQSIEAQMLELKTKDRSTLLEITKITGQREGTENPFFDVIFNHIDFYHVYKKIEIPTNQFHQTQGLKFRNFEMSNTYLDINFYDVPDGECMMEYALNREFKSGISVAKFHQYFMHVLDCFLNDHTKKVSNNDIVLMEEGGKLLKEFNDTLKEFDSSLSVIDLFNKRVEAHPEKQAVIIKDKVYTYNELDALSNQFANYLNREKKIIKGDLVGIKLHRSEWLIIAILAIWKSGGAYVPIDPTYPKSRTVFMEDDSGCQTIVDAEMLKQFIAEQDQYASTYNLQPIDQRSLAYIIYTSGSTGQPKGVMIEHTALANFLHGMTDALPLDESDHLLTLTSISFDISILELFWTLCNGIKITIKENNTDYYDFDNHLQNNTKLDFSLFYFASQNSNDDDKYKLLMDSARFADENNFKAIWLPERHFHEFGGIFPNPSLLGASIATITKNIDIRSGSVVLPIHDTIRVAEEWSVVDNLSKGRVALSIASGWHANDFVFKPKNYTERREVMYDQINELKALWNGKPVKRLNGLGKEVELNIYPKPIQKDIPIWITSAGSIETFKSAGKIGANLLTHMLGQDINVLEANIKAYKEELVRNGFPVDKASITLMLHTYLGKDMHGVKEVVKEPFKNYLRSSVGLLKNLLSGMGVEDSSIDESELEDLLEMVFERYWNTSALFGTKESCRKTLDKLFKIGVTEIGCLIDFGIEDSKVMEGLTFLNELKNEFKGKKNSSEHQPITSMQITPSYLGALLEDKESHNFLKSLKHLIVGGELFQEGLKKKALNITDAVIHNMYGPTETTVWSTFCKVEAENGNFIGRPIANTQIYILNRKNELCPIGVKGQLYIGGKGLSRGYNNQEKTTREKFIVSPFNKNEKIYNTGDLARWLPDGTIEFFGREDGQVKIRGHRIELGEIESHLTKIKDIDSAVVIDRELKAGQKELVAYITSKSEQKTSELRSYLMNKLPSIMVPAYFIQIDKIPLTSNGKVDKKVLLNFHDQMDATPGIDYIAPSNDTENELVKIWEEILNKKQIGVKNSFFEMGGNSINVVRLRRMIKKSMNVSISIVDLFKYVTIEDIARVINREQQISEDIEESVDVMRF